MRSTCEKMKGAINRDERIEGKMSTGEKGGQVENAGKRPDEEIRDIV